MKTLRELSISLENRPGALSEVSDLLGANGVNILGLTVRTETGSGYLNFVAPSPERVKNVLEAAGYNPTVRDIIAAEAPHHPGGLNALLKPLKRANVNVDYLYSCIGAVGAGEGSIVLLAVDDVPKATEALSKEWIRLYGEELFAF